MKESKSSEKGRFTCIHEPLWMEAQEQHQMNNKYDQNTTPCAFCCTDFERWVSAWQKGDKWNEEMPKKIPNARTSDPYPMWTKRLQLITKSERFFRFHPPCLVCAFTQAVVDAVVRSRLFHLCYRFAIVSGDALGEYVVWRSDALAFSSPLVALAVYYQIQLENSSDGAPLNTSLFSHILSVWNICSAQ